MAFFSGRECTLRIGVSEIINVRDVNINLTAETMSVETRNTGGWVQQMQGSKTGEVSFDMVLDHDDSSITTLRTAFLDATKVDIASQEKHGTWTSSGYITEFSTTEPLNDFVSISVKIVTGAWSFS